MKYILKLIKYIVFIWIFPIINELAVCIGSTRTVQAVTTCLAVLGGCTLHSAHLCTKAEHDSHHIICHLEVGQTNDVFGARWCQSEPETGSGPDCTSMQQHTPGLGRARFGTNLGPTVNALSALECAVYTVYG